MRSSLISALRENALLVYTPVAIIADRRSMFLALANDFSNDDVGAHLKTERAALIKFWKSSHALDGLFKLNDKGEPIANFYMLPRKWQPATLQSELTALFKAGSLDIDAESIEEEIMSILSDAVEDPTSSTDLNGLKKWAIAKSASMAAAFKTHDPSSGTKVPAPVTAHTLLTKHVEK